MQTNPATPEDVPDNFWRQVTETTFPKENSPLRLYFP